MTEILQQTIPYNPLALRPLPGIQPLDMGEWLRPDEAFGAQMQARADLIATRRADVIACLPEARDCARELLDLVLVQACGLTPDRAAQVDKARRADGIEIHIDRGDPMGTLGHLVQQDLLLLQKPEGEAEHRLDAAVLCFPASWTLAEKIGKPLLAIHRPVEEYDAGLARRVQRLFDGVQVGRPLWRYNALWYPEATLFHPLREAAPRAEVAPQDRRFMRSELQCVLRLPQTRAVVFSVHTRILRREAVMAQWGDLANPNGPQPVA